MVRSIVRFCAAVLAQASMILALGGLVATPAMADVQGEMNSYFNKSGAAANVTGPTAFQGQSAGYYSGGSLWSRFPQKSINPVSVALPSARGGCGGIDLFAGSFSFINADEIVAMLKATANNAIGFAFQLCDDLLDVCSTVDAVGKDVGQDDDTTTFVDLWGECRTRAAVRQSLTKAVEAVGHDSPLALYVLDLFQQAELGV